MYIYIYIYIRISAAGFSDEVWTFSAWLFVKLFFLRGDLTQSKGTSPENQPLEGLIREHFSRKQQCKYEVWASGFRG